MTLDFFFPFGRFSPVKQQGALGSGKMERSLPLFSFINILAIQSWLKIHKLIPETNLTKVSGWAVC